MRLDAQHASRFARLALGHVTRPWPHVFQHVMTEPSDAIGSPIEAHPVFFGSFDWHSCVHGYWLLARALRRFPDLPEATEIRALFDQQLVPEKVEGEIAYFRRPGNRSFERPYGWAWLMALVAELGRHQNQDANRWASALRPLADELTARMEAFLAIARYPIRAGTHANTAFAMILTTEYATTIGDAALLARCRERASLWYADDRDCQAWEPSLNDFLSPTLIEAACMRVAMRDHAFTEWFSAFLPNAHVGEPRALFEPVTVPDRADGQISHLDGLNFSRAWCWRMISSGLSTGHPLQPLLAQTAVAHVQTSLPHLADSYAGEHWLATFAMLALDPDPA